MQARATLAHICSVVRSSVDCEGAGLHDMVLALRASADAGEAVLVVAVAAPELCQAQAAVDRAVQLIGSLRF